MKFTILLTQLCMILGDLAMCKGMCRGSVPEDCINNPRVRLLKEKNYNLQLCHNGQCIPSEISDGEWLKCKDGKWIDYIYIANY